MSIGVSVFLIAVGAIVAFALNVESSWLDLDVVGWVLMIAGVIGLAVTLMLRRRRVRVSQDGRSTVEEIDSSTEG